MSAYRAVLSARFRMLLQYRAAALAGMSTQLFWGLIRVMIFEAFYRSSTAIQPMTFPEVVNYVWLGQAMFAMLPWSIDTEIRCCKWYDLVVTRGVVKSILPRADLLIKPNVKVLAFDIETFKKPLKFPDSKSDPIMMISLCIRQQAYLITNREIVGDDVADHDYSPKPEYSASVTVYNAPNEKALLLKFGEVIKEVQPHILTSFNGDKFDWPYIETRGTLHNLNLESVSGVKNQENFEYFGRFMIHLDCFYWVERDSYLPQGSHGLKAVTRAKLGYQPEELDPELMVPLAEKSPMELAIYAVSDAVATYHLFHKHIFDFIFALCTIIPLSPDEVLRKGSGTLCEQLLMAQAFRGDIVFPNKQKDVPEKFYQGHLLDNETYIGGKVEGLCSGIYRSDFKYKFKLNRETYRKLLAEVDMTIDFVATVENDEPLDKLVNRQEIRGKIEEMLGVLE